jgi:endonuclease YncB( thermonuclease family)
MMNRSPLSACFLWVGLLLGLVLVPILSHAEFVGKVVGVIDGDSIRVMRKGKAEQIRLLGIDCPEKRQPFGTRAKEYTSELAFGKDVTVYGDKRDRYGRTLAEVLLPDGRSLNQEIIKAGLAWWFRNYSNDLRLAELERQAQLAKKGLWIEPHPVPPWEWRKGMRPTSNRTGSSLN